jgi:outer membrane receptor protein involved in Fe transport
MFPAGFSSKNSSFGLAILGTGSGGSGYGALSNGEEASNEQRQLNGVDNLSIASGAHQFKFGVDYRWLSPLAGSPAYQQQLSFRGVAGPAGAALSGVAAEADIQSSQGFVELLSENFSLYGEDSWKLGPRLTATYGLRWDVDGAMRGKGAESQLFRVTNLNQPAKLGLGGRGGPLYRTELGDVAPRLGFALSTRASTGLGVSRAGGRQGFFTISAMAEILER